MAHKHEVVDANLSFLIDPKTRTITQSGGNKTVLIQHDHNSERCTFEIPRFVDGHDMSLCNQVRVHFINTDGLNAAKGIYAVDDVQVYGVVNSQDGDKECVIFSWLISANATKYVGALSFVVSLECVTGSVVDYRWQTEAYTNIVVNRGIYNTDYVAEEIVEDAVIKAVEMYLNENPVGAEIYEARTDAINAKDAAEAAQAVTEDILAECREIAESGGLVVDDEVTADGTGAVSGAAVAAYVAQQLSAFATYAEVTF